MHMNTAPLRLSMGYDDLGAIIENEFSIVDKSLLIRDIIEEKAQVVLITRPRRFGKTLGLSWLRYFFAREVIGRPTHGMFDCFKVSQYLEIMKHQGKYPVISITFKDLKDKDYTGALASFAQSMSTLYDEHRLLLASDTLHADEKKGFDAILNQEAHETALKAALFNLTKYLYRHFGVRPIVLIDEYDTPIQAAYLYGYYEPMILFMRNFLGSALKNNPYLHKAVLTGILRVAKESLFSGLNNLEVYSLLKQKYAPYFGFTEEEVVDLFQRAGLSEHMGEVHHWYDGYRMGGIHIYNPWSIVHCINENAHFEPYWVHTSDNDLIKQLLGQAPSEIKISLEALVRGDAIVACIDEHMVFPNLERNPEGVWSLLLMSGYLTSHQTQQQGTRFECLLKCPNQEVAFLYQDIIRAWFSDPFGYNPYEALLQCFVTGNVGELKLRLSQYLLETMSFFDTTDKEPERFYHGLVLGLLVGLEKTHEVTSNRESGLGRYDVMLIPKDKKAYPLGVIIEFKTSQTHAALKKEAQSALKQIEEKQYTAQLRKAGVRSFLNLGIAFHKKSLEVASHQDSGS